MTEMAMEARKVVTSALKTGMDKAISFQTPAVKAHIRRMRRSRPDATPAEIVEALEKHFLATVSGLGAAAGGPAAMPGPGQLVTLALAGGEILSVLEATGLFALAVAEVHGVEIEDLERRRTLVLAVIMGEASSSVIEKIAGKTGKYWGKALTKAIPMTKIAQINKVLGHNFVTKYGTRQGILVIGRELPFGFGAVIGGGGNYFIGRLSVKAARRAFGPAPTAWPIEAPEDLSEPDQGTAVAS
jgi:hypothetical protein